MTKESRQFETPDGASIQIGDILFTDGMINESDPNSDAYLLLPVILLVSGFTGASYRKAVQAQLLGLDKSRYKKECIRMEDDELDYMSFVDSGHLSPFYNPLVISRWTIYDILHKAREASLNGSKSFKFKESKIHMRSVSMDNGALGASGKLLKTGVRIRDIRLWPVNAIRTWVNYEIGEYERDRYYVEIIHDEIVLGHFSKAMKILNTVRTLQKLKAKKVWDEIIKSSSKRMKTTNTQNIAIRYDAFINEVAHDTGGLRIGMSSQDEDDMTADAVIGNESSVATYSSQSANIGTNEEVSPERLSLRFIADASIGLREGQVYYNTTTEDGRGYISLVAGRSRHEIALRMSLIRYYDKRIMVNIDRSVNQVVSELIRVLQTGHVYARFKHWSMLLLGYAQDSPRNIRDYKMMELEFNTDPPTSFLVELLSGASVEEFELGINYPNALSGPILVDEIGGRLNALDL